MRCVRFRVPAVLGSLCIAACRMGGSTEPVLPEAHTELPTVLTDVDDAGVSSETPSTTAGEFSVVSESDAGEPLPSEPLTEAWEKIVQTELDFSAYDEAVENYVRANGLDGATSAVVHRELGIVHVAGYGDFDQDRLSLLASSGKVISVGVLLYLADQGLLDIDEPIGLYLGETFGLGGGRKENLTVAQLLSNSSGLVGLLDDAFYAPYLCQFDTSTTLRECAEAVYTTDEDWWGQEQPDTRFRYGGAAWQLAGGIAEVVSGKSWHELIDEIYVQGCHMNSLGFRNQYEKNATTYPEDFAANPDPSLLAGEGNPSIEGGSYVTPIDYAKLLLMHLREGQCGERSVLSPEAIERMQEDRLATYGGSTFLPNLAGYGMGWWVDRTQPGLVVDNGLYGASAWIDNERGYGALLVVETDAVQGAVGFAAVKPHLDSLFDAPLAQP